MAVCNGNMPFDIRSLAHGPALAKGVQDLFKNKRGADFDFRWGENTVRTHRLILELFLGPEIVGYDTSKRDNSGVYHQDYENGNESKMLSLLLEFLYTGEVCVVQKELEALLTLAKELKFKLLVDEIEGIMRTEIYKECEDNEKTCCTYNGTNDREADSDPDMQSKELNFDCQYQEDNKFINVVNSVKLEKVHCKDHDLNGSGYNSGNDFPPVIAKKLSRGSFGDVEESMLVERHAILKPCHVNLGSRKSIVRRPVAEENTREDVNKVCESVARLKSKAGEPITSVASHNSNRWMTKHLDSIISRLVQEAEKCEDGDEESGGSEPEHEEALPAVVEFRHLSEDMIKLEPRDLSVADGQDQCEGEKIGIFEREEEEEEETQLPTEVGLQSMQPSKRIKLEPCEELVTGCQDEWLEDEGVIGSVEPGHFQLVNEVSDDDPGSVSREPGSSQERVEQPESYSCAHCTFKTTKCHIYYYHLQSAHGLTTRLERTPKTRKCNACDFKTTKHTELRRHQIVAHTFASVAPPTNGQYTCSTCKKGYQTLAQLNQHTKIHSEKRHKCELCPFDTVYKSSLKSHLKVVHGQGTCRFTCETCGQRCFTNQNLEEHIRTHTQEKPYNCPYCSYTANLKQQVKRHLITNH